MRKYITFIFVLLILGVLATLNPSSDVHRQEVENAIAERNPILGNIGAEKALVAAGEYNNYVFFSTLSLGDEEMSIGGLGFVYATPPPASELAFSVIPDLPPTIQDKITEALPERERVIKSLPTWLQEQMQSKR